MGRRGISSETLKLREIERERGERENEGKSAAVRACTLHVFERGVSSPAKSVYTHCRAILALRKYIVVPARISGTSSMGVKRVIPRSRGRKRQGRRSGRREGTRKQLVLEKK